MNVNRTKFGKLRLGIQKDEASKQQEKGKTSKKRGGGGVVNSCAKKGHSVSNGGRKSGGKVCCGELMSVWYFLEKKSGVGVLKGN